MEDNEEKQKQEKKTNQQNILKSILVDNSFGWLIYLLIAIVICLFLWFAHIESMKELEIQELEVQYNILVEQNNSNNTVE